VIVNSHFTAGISTRRFPAAPAEVMYYPVSAPDPPANLAALRTEVRRELQTPDDSTVIVMTCRLEPYKGHTLLLDALGRLRDQPGWEAWIAGGIQRPHEREFLDELRRRAEVAGVADRVRFLGQRSDVPKLLAAADIHCQPNLGPEPFGIAFIEAMYAGLPIVTTGIGGALEIVTEACGILVPPNDPAALADILAGLLADPSRRAALGSCGPSRARQLCDPAVILERLAEILKRLRVSQNSLSQ
jgi:glycosyltransferase involved in cell wall biosynthesis